MHYRVRSIGPGIGTLKHEALGAAVAQRNQPRKPSAISIADTPADTAAQPLRWLCRFSAYPSAESSTLPPPPIPLPSGDVCTSTTTLNSLGVLIRADQNHKAAATRANSADA
jgi:hypothetical protein